MASQQDKHCRYYGWLAGDCGMLACKRCGKNAYARLQARITAAASQHAELFFVTIYYDPRWLKDLSHLPLFKDHKAQIEKQFRVLISKIFRSLRDKARRAGARLEYVVVLALAKVKHRIHKVLHSHALVTWLPDTRHRKNSRRPERLECPWLEKKLSKDHLIAWVEKPRNRHAVARYTAQNAKSIIGKEEYKGIHVYRMSRGFEGNFGR